MQPYRVVIVATATIAAATLAASHAHADSWGQVDCSREPLPPECRVAVIDPGTSEPVDEGGNGTGEPVCRIDGQVVPCHDPGLGWLHSDGCYHSPDPRIGPGPNWWARTCYEPAGDSYYSGGWVWREDPPASVAPVVQRAVDRLAIPQLDIAANPRLDGRQVVHVPVWWWVEPDEWRTRTASASIPALTITAEVTPMQVTWHAGDGTSTTCAGPGTPWTADRNPAAASPTCGHTYTAVSRTSPDGTYSLRADVTWQISWSGGGMNGTVPAVTTSTTAEIAVVELRSVVTN